jgi:glycosyltransferase involved in cell wall biosynthesis
MRVVEIISGLGLGGAERALARRLNNAPLDIETHVIVTGPQDSHLCKQIREQAILHQDVSATGRLVNQLKPDLVLTHNPREALSVLSHPNLPRRYPVAVIAHNEISSEYRMKATLLNSLLPRLNSRARMHIAVSTRAARGVQCLGAADLRVCLLGGTFDQTQSPLLDYWPQNTKHRILVLSRLSPQKNLRALVDAVTLQQDYMRAFCAHLVIAGDGELMKTLTSEIHARDIADLMTFPGWIDNTDGLLAAAQTLLITSSHEGGPLTLYEALLAGIRVVSTPVGAAADVLVDDPHIRILPNDTPRALGDGLRVILQDSPPGDHEVLARRTRNEWLQATTRANAFYELCREAAS